MMRELVKTYTVIRGAEVLFPSGREVIGKCPRCGGNVTESKKGFFCESQDCRFGLWKDNKFLTAKRINLTKKDAAALLAGERVHKDKIYSDKTGKTYAADMREYLEPEEKELLDLTDSVLGKLETISDANFAELELFPDFDINE